MKKITNLQTTKKGLFGVCTFSPDKKVFFKQCNYEIDDEINGYDFVKDRYKVPKRLYYNKKTKFISYEYNDNLFNKTLHNGLYNGCEFDIDLIVDMLTKPFENMVKIDEEICVNSKFFKQRLNFIDNYLNLDNVLFDKNIIIDGKDYGTFRQMLIKIKNAISLKKKVYSIISQGDPTDLNIGVGAEISDYEVAGQNSAIGEIAIFLSCFILNSYYYYIKYVNSSHKLFTDTLNKYSSFIAPIYSVVGSELYIKMNGFIPQKNKELILKYLDKIKDYEMLNNNDNLGKYLAFRFISPVNLASINEEKDLIALIFTAVIFSKVNSINDIISYIREV